MDYHLIANVRRWYALRVRESEPRLYRLTSRISYSYMTYAAAVFIVYRAAGTLYLECAICVPAAAASVGRCYLSVGRCCLLVFTDFDKQYSFYSYRCGMM